MSNHDEVGFGGARITPLYPNPLPVNNMPKETPGLENTTGTSCYLNATLQCLFHCPPLRALFLNFVDHRVCDSSTFCSRCAMGRFATKFFSHFPRETFGPDEIIESLEEICPEFDPDDQQDALEFLIQLTEHIAKSELAQSAPSAKASTKALMHTPIYRIIGGSLSSLIICLTCRNARESTEFMQSVSLPTENSETVADALLKYVQYEKIDVRLECAHCQTATECVKHYLIRRAPNVLILNLLPQYQLSSRGKMMKSQKGNSCAQISERLDISPFMVDPERRCGGVYYNLTGVIVHRGRTMRSGHYVAYVKGKNGKWFLKDDETSVQVPVGKVLNQTAYILFYQKETETEESHLVHMQNYCTFSVPEPQMVPEERMWNNLCENTDGELFSPDIAQHTEKAAEPLAPATFDRSSAGGLGDWSRDPSADGVEVPGHRSLYDASHVYRRLEDAEAGAKIDEAASKKGGGRRAARKKRFMRKENEGRAEFHKSLYNPSMVYRPILDTDGVGRGRGCRR